VLFHGVPGIPCESGEQPTVYFCPEHYIEHVEGAHDGVPLAGCMSLNAARLYLASRSDNG
jgi:hypothetical protein